MKILAHRGYWHRSEEKNTPEAIARAFENGYGIETDVRDACGKLVISHDMPHGQEMTLESLLELASQYAFKPSLALNIKSDGLANSVKEICKKYPSTNYFFFDMSVPDMRGYIKNKQPVFTRLSEVERAPVWLTQSAGVWLDAFESEWYGEKIIEQYLKMNIDICVVSSELHGRNQDQLWKMLSSFKDHSGMMICTDFPQSAEKIFTGNI
jgi:glycerophosphoryl diester phosphodiesterase